MLGRPEVRNVVVSYHNDPASSVVAGCADHRITNQTESDAASILEACASLGLDCYRLSDGLFQAAALVHHATYHVDLPNVEPEYIRQEIESRVRLADYFSCDILDEAQNGIGTAAKLGKTPFPRN